MTTPVPSSACVLHTRADVLLMFNYKSISKSVVLYMA